MPRLGVCVRLLSASVGCVGCKEARQTYLMYVSPVAVWDRLEEQNFEYFQQYYAARVSLVVSALWLTSGVCKRASRVLTAKASVFAWLFCGQSACTMRRCVVQVYVQVSVQAQECWPASFDCLLAWSCFDGLICHSDLTRKFLVQQRARSEL